MTKWKAQDTEVGGRRWQVISDNPNDRVIVGDGLSESSARLIAAAPEMLSLLKAALIDEPEHPTYKAVVWETSVRALLARIDGQEG